MRNQPPSEIGSRVRTAKVLGPASDYTEEGRRKRRADAEGVVTDFSDSHGLCYEVKHPGGERAWYDPEELSYADPPHRNLATDSLAASIMRS